MRTFTREEQSLLTRMRGLGGWVSASFIEPSRVHPGRQSAAERLLADGLIERAEDDRVVQLTDAGREMAAGMEWVDG